MTIDKVKVVFFGSNPSETEPLQLETEVKRLDSAIRRSEHRKALDLFARLKVSVEEVIQYLLEEKPTIVHFSGHASNQGELYLDDGGHSQPATAELLKQLFSTLPDSIRLVVLNACYSEIQAQAIAEVVDCVIGMSSEIADDAAISFSASLYRGIGFGLSIHNAFEQGRISLGAAGFNEETIPALLVKPGVDARSSTLIQSGVSDRSIYTRVSEVADGIPAVIDIHTEFFNNLTKALWDWRFMAIQVSYYGEQYDANDLESVSKLTAIAERYDKDVWHVIAKIRTEVSRAQRYVSFGTYSQLLALYVFITEFDKQLSTQIFRINTEAFSPWAEVYSEFQSYIYSEVTDTIEEAIGVVAAELKLNAPM